MTDTTDTNNNPGSSLPAADTGGAQVILNLEEMIKNSVTSIDRSKVELKKQREMLEDIFNNDPTFKLHSDKVKEANKVKMGTRAQIMKQPNVSALSEKVKEIKTQIKELEGALSDYLKEYARLSGTNEIEGEDGEVREIIYLAKLVKKNSKFGR